MTKSHIEESEPREITVGDVVKVTHANGDVDFVEVRKMSSFEVPASEAHRFDDGVSIELAAEEPEELRNQIKRIRAANKDASSPTVGEEKGETR